MQVRDFRWQTNLTASLPVNWLLSLGYEYLTYLQHRENLPKIVNAHHMILRRYHLPFYVLLSTNMFSLDFRKDLFLIILLLLTG